jgi:hypothetical protein
LTEPTLLTADIRDSKGNVVKSLADGTRQMEIGTNELDWTPEPSTPKGIYNLHVRLMATYSTRERVAKEMDMPVTYQ